MSNSIYQSMQNSQMIREFNDFRRRYANVNPQEELMRMVQSGKISQQQLNEAQRKASLFSFLLN